MARLARAEVFAFDEVAIVHVMNRVVRRCFLLGDDPISGKNYDHRKVWIESLLRRFAAHFGIDLLGFAILSNHFHLILRSRPDVVQEWDDAEVARRWLMLCPYRKEHLDQPLEPNEMELNTIVNDETRLIEIRKRLSDISWWMRLLCQNIGQRSNREDKEKGRFFQERFRAVRLLDEEAILACAAYVDLNPIRAALAETLEGSDFTSIQRRIQALKSSEARLEQAELTQAMSSQAAPDGFLSPIPLHERSGVIGAALNSQGLRASDKGFLPMSLGDYLQLLDWTARQMVNDKRGRTPAELAPIFQRMGMDVDVWCDLVGGFGRLFYNVAGRPQTVDKTPSRLTQQRYYLRSEARKLLMTGQESART